MWDCHGALEDFEILESMLERLVLLHLGFTVDFHFLISDKCIEDSRVGVFGLMSERW